MSYVQTVRYASADGNVTEYKYHKIAGKSTSEYHKLKKREQRAQLPRKGRRIDASKVETIAKMLEQRVSQSQIARFVGVARSTVAKVRAAQNL